MEEQSIFFVQDFVFEPKHDWKESFRFVSGYLLYVKRQETHICVQSVRFLSSQLLIQQAGCKHNLKKVTVLSLSGAHWYSSHPWCSSFSVCIWFTHKMQHESPTFEHKFKLTLIMSHSARISKSLLMDPIQSSQNHIHGVFLPGY